MRTSDRRTRFVPSFVTILAAIAAAVAGGARSPAQDGAQDGAQNGAQGGARPATAPDLLQPEDLIRLRRVGGLALSPDGSELLYTVRTTDLAANKGETRTFLRSTAGGAPAIQVATGGSPAFVGAERFAAVESGTLQLIGREHVDGEPPSTAIALPPGAGNVLLSPDGKRFLFTAPVLVDPQVTARHPDLPLANAREYDDLMVRHWDQWNDGTFSHLFVQDLAPGSAPVDLLAGERVHTPLPPFGGAEQLAWSPDGSEICYTARRVADPEASTDSQLFAVNLAAATADGERAEHRCLTTGNPGYDQDPVYSPNGKWIAYSSMARGGFESDKARLMLHDRGTGENRELLPELDAAAHGVVWTRDSASLFFTVDVEGTTQVYRAEVAQRGTSGAVAVTKGRHALSSLQVAPDGRTLYALRTTMERCADVVQIDVATGAIRQLTDANEDTWGRLAMPVIDGEWFEASDGKRIHAWIVKPPGFDPAKKYPFLLYCQGGPQSMVGQGFSFRWNFHLMAAQGYVVAGVNRRGLPGFGQAWNDEISRDWGGQAMRDLLSVCDAMQNRPYIDRDRSAAIGASFGGYTVYWLMGNAGDRFAAMIAHCGVFNLESMYLATEELFFVNWDLGGPFWASPEVAADYRRFSPHRYVQNWKTPLMVIEGERDFRVPYDQGLQAFTAAQLMGVESRLLVFPDEGHWVLQPQNGVLWHREFFAWLDRFCKERTK